MAHPAALPSPVTRHPQPFRDGIPWQDPDSGLVYRVLPVLAPLDGWATSGFWQERWRLPHEDVLRLTQVGLLDAALESGSGLRKYRCRDERLALESEHMRRIRDRLARQAKAEAAQADRMRRKLMGVP